MHASIARFCSLAFLLTSVAAFAGDEKKCPAAARACEQRIRQMLVGRHYLGAVFVDLHPGLGIKSVAPVGPAARAGLKEGDRILAVNDHWTRNTSVREFKQKLIATVFSAGRVTLLVQRQGTFRRIEVRLEPYSKQQIDTIVSAHVAQSHSDSADPHP